jgi:hypothetical protein
MKYLTVRVTKEHIQRGRRGEEESCPLALAVREAGYHGALVGELSWRPHPDIHEWNTLQLPEAASQFIRLFDNNLPVKPATFRLPLL